MNRQKIEVIDLFSGVGGFTLGALRAGFDLALSVELDKYPAAAHKLNFPNSKHLNADIAELTGEKLLENANLKKGELGGLVGGPPCQGFSSIGKRDVTDSRNSLFTKFFELVHQCQPQFFVAENVLGILDKVFSDIRNEALNTVSDEYVLLDPFVINAADYGAPTTRKRVFFIGYKKNLQGTLSIEDFTARKVKGKITVADALKGLPEQICREWITEEDSWRSVEMLPSSPFWDRVQDHIPTEVGDAESLNRYQNGRVVSGCFGTRHSEHIQQRYGNLKPGERDKISKSVRLNSEGFCPTLRAGTSSDRGGFQAVRPIHPNMPRVITPREAARLQGFPDWFRFAPTKWQSFRQIGNSISPLVAETIFEVIMSCLYPTVEMEIANE